MYKTYPESKTQLKSAEVIYNYIYGGRGILTLEAPSGNSHSYAFYRPQNKSSFPDDIIFIYAAHNNDKLFYIGMLERDAFRLTRNSRFLEDTDIVKGAKYIVKMAHRQSLCDSTPMKIYHEGMCARCGREITDENSKEVGFGPKCRKKSTC